jgi:hypothetical protein
VIPPRQRDDEQIKATRRGESAREAISITLWNINCGLMKDQEEIQETLLLII